MTDLTLKPNVFAIPVSSVGALRFPADLTIVHGTGITLTQF